MNEQDLWIFGYGSLMWHPDFAHVEAEIATLHGFGRGFTMRSIHHRGTEAHPGLVLALSADAQARCTGLAFRVRPGDEDQTMVELRARELVSYAYQEMRLPVRLADGREVQAVTYVIDKGHAQYTGPVLLEAQAQIIAHAHGGRGPNADYLFSTHTHLVDLGIEDADIAWLDQRVRSLSAA